MKLGPRQNTPPLYLIILRNPSLMKSGSMLEHTPLYQPKDGELISHDSQKTIRTDPTYLSFGDGGTTATVTEWGQQMQISRYLGHGESGIYAIDHAHTPEPNQYTKRRQGFLDMIDTSQGFGTDSGLPDSEWEHTTYWLRNRWPRVVFKRKDKWELTFQWVVWNNVVIHDLLWQNLTENETIYVDVWTTLEILIRELDFVNSSHSFNGETCSRYQKGPGPGGYGFVKLHRFQQNGQSNDGQTMPTLKSHGNDFNADAVAAAIGVFENGNPLKKEEFFHQREITIKAGENRRLVTGYKLVLLSTEKKDWKLLTLTKGDVDIDYFLCQSQLEDSIPRDTFLSDRDFYIGRNLEHILSVCAIPITSAPAENDGEDEGANQKGEEPMVALTCGDIAGHRICTSAS
ncbi:uncharacterized protein LDX57_009271 [Aspergillus melleus]|uniref:uncharacterized protein n=1 Tax=Aspergillus melleus TaxID=138277 RepID=UPI001E8CFE91|nr:uncharacterized protein LDX57_009271 [Aspergillus melleus]KAH8431614.1 hypothetical protein LDX57_009271 [Aspergillus melleus]